MNKLHALSSAIASALMFSAVPCLASPDAVVTFNEIQYNPAGPSEAGEWVELFNQMGIKVDLSGWRIDGIGYTFPSGTIINPGSYLVVARTPVAGQLGPFTGAINNDGQKLRLINQSDRMMDELVFADLDPWPAGADGSGCTLAKLQPYTASTPHANWAVSSQIGGTAGLVNFPDVTAPPPTVTSSLFALSKVWRFNESGVDQGPGWANTVHPVAGNWRSGPGALAYETSPHTITFGTALKFPGLNSPYVVTYYFETEFTATAAQATSIQALKLRYAIDDGAVFHLNGTEVFRYNMPGGTLTAATFASANLEAPALSASVPIPSGALVAGSNRLSVEVHQFAAGNSDVVFGAELDVDNLAPVPGAPPLLRINEIPPGSTASFWLELANTGTSAINPAGIVVSIEGDPLREYALPAGSLAPGGLLLLDQATLGFRPLDAEKIFLFTAGKAALIDTHEQTTRLRGRSSERAGAWLYPTAASPGAANTFVFSDAVVISEIQYNPPALAPTPEILATWQTTTLIAHGDAWRYNNADENLPGDWAATAHPEGGNWKSGPAPIGVESAVLPVPLATVLTPYVPATVTYYFERDFTVTPQQLAGADSIQITRQIDDGAVFYLNGTEIGTRFNMPGDAVGPETLASSSLGDAALGSMVLPVAGLVAGTNRLSVEVHQGSTGSSDIVFGLKLEARVQLTPRIPGQPLRSSNNTWVEIANRSAAPVNLTGWDFSNGINFNFAANTILAPGEHACVVKDAALFAAAYPTARRLGAFTGSLSGTTDHLALRDANKNPVDDVRYYDNGQWPGFADGGGSSMELRDLHADNDNGSSWAASDESSHTAWKTYTYSGTAAGSNGPDGQWAEFNMGLLAAGELWLDDVSVIENPAGAATQKLTDTGFNDAAAWRLRGNHRHGGIISEPGNAANKILRLVATGPTEHMHNQVETTLTSAITNGAEYQISFRARWVTGSNQLHTRLYFNRLARVNVIDRPADPGTPSAPNSTAIVNAGPTYSALKHAPAVPAVSQAITVSALASDPDNVASMSLLYSVNGAAFVSAPMALTGSGKYEGAIPGQTAGAVIQYYLRGTDGAGAVTFCPAAGPDSRALCKVNDGAAATNGWHNFRIITTNADRDFMHTPTEVMSNDRIEATVIDRETDIYYDVGIRLKSSERGRNQPGRVAYNLDFPSAGLYRGALAGLAVDRSEGGSPGQKELLFDIMISNSGGPISRYYDFIKILAPRADLTTGATLQMARYDNVFLDEQFDHGSDGSEYEYEYVYYPTTTSDGTPTGAKLPEPDNVVGVGINDLGDDKERYRWNFLNKINREADNYDAIINYCKLFSKSGADFEAALPAAIDLDTWFRGLSYAVLSGAGDNAGAGDGHNCIYYARPDGRVIFLPHDMDLGFDAARSIFANGQAVTLTANPARRRQYLGHLHDIISTTYNNAYMSLWTTHFATLDPSQPWSTHLAYMTSRSDNVLAQISGQIPSVPFAITTAAPVSAVNGSVTIAGNGWVNVRGIRLTGTTGFLPVTWTGNSTWQILVPVPPGQTTLNLQAVNFSGAVIGSASIIAQNSSTITPASAANLVVSEISYHPGNLTPAEVLAGITDPDQFEFLEVMNISPNLTADLTGVSFTTGISYDFAAGTTLLPGDRLVVARDRAAFTKRYPAATGKLAAGAFLNATALSNSGESILLADAGGATIKSFTYDDKFPWPESPDGNGDTLVLIAPLTNPDHNLPANWRSSVAASGSPGTGDATTFAGTPTADADRDGLNALLEYAIGTSDASANPVSPTESADGTSFVLDPGDFLVFTAYRNLAADDIRCEAQLSTDLTAWSSASLVLVSDIPAGGGRSKMTWHSTAPLTVRTFARLAVSQR